MPLMILILLLRLLTHNRIKKVSLFKCTTEADLLNREQEHYLTLFQDSSETLVLFDNTSQSTEMDANDFLKIGEYRID